MGRLPKEKPSNNLSAQNAETAYQILNQVFNKDGKSMFDMMFEMDLSENAFNDFPEKEKFREECRIAEREGKLNDKEFFSKMYDKYPQAFEKNVNFGIEIRKVFLLNQQNMDFAKELSRLYTGKESTDIKEAVGNAFTYIVFLRQV